MNTNKAELNVPTQRTLYASTINGEVECSTEEKTENVWGNFKKEGISSFPSNPDYSLLDKRLKQQEEGYKKIEAEIDAFRKELNLPREPRGLLSTTFISIVSGDWNVDKLRQIGGDAHRVIRNALSRSVHLGRSVDSRFPQPPAIQRIDIAEEDGNISESESSDDERIVPDNRTFKPLPSFAEKKERT